jgi:hypothetical protein
MDNKWEDAASIIAPIIFKITTHAGTGTGFLLKITGPRENKIYGIATAYHVISAAEELGMPIKLTHYLTNSSVILQADPSIRSIIIYPEVDLAFILFPKSLLNVDITAPNIVEQGVTKNAGLEIGWYGFPNVAINQLSFFHGFISSPLPTGYLVDGVVIHGVSGAPAFFIEDNLPKICGVITQYIPNIATGQPLPGLSYISSVESYQQLLSSLPSLNEAEKIAEEQREKTASPSPSPSQPPPETEQ